MAMQETNLEAISGASAPLFQRVQRLLLSTIAGTNRRGTAAAAAAVLALSAMTACSPQPARPTSSPCIPATQAGDIIPDPRGKVDPYQLTFSPDGTRVAAGCPDATCVWDTNTGAVSMRLADGSYPSWSPDGTQLSVGMANGEIATFDAHSGAELHRMVGHQARTETNDTIRTVTGLTYSPDGEVLVSTGTDCTIRTWNTSDGTAKDTIAINTGQVTAIAVDPTGEHVAVASTDQDASLWSLKSLGLLRSLTDAPPDAYGVAFDPAGQFLAIGAGEPINTARIYDVDSGKVTATAPTTGEVSAVAFSPDGATLAYARPQERDVVLWNVDGSQTKHLAGLDNGVYALAFNSDGSVLYTASSYDGIISWNIADGTVRTRFELPH